jgi:DNA polymerase elongation subunit (family B)
MDERALLCAFWEYVRARKFSKVVGYNIDQFDLPMLIIRGLKHGIAIGSIVKNSLDLRKKVFFGADNHRGKLWEFQELLGIKFPYSRFHKTDMYLMWSTPDIFELQQFLLRDVKITWQLYVQAREAGLV